MNRAHRRLQEQHSRKAMHGPWAPWEEISRATVAAHSANASALWPDGMVRETADELFDAHVVMTSLCPKRFVDVFEKT